MPATRSHTLSQGELEILTEQLKNREKRIAEQEQQFKLTQQNFEEFLEKERQNIREEEGKNLAELHITIKSLKDKILNLESQISEMPEIIEQSSSSARASESRSPSFSLGLRDVISEIPTFSGTNISIDRFSQACRRARDALSPHQEADLVKAVRTKIFGRAYCIIEEERFSKINDLLDSLKTKLHPLKSSYYYRGLLSDIFKNSAEHIIDYIQRVKDLKISIQDAERQEGRALDPHIDNFTLDCFVNGLPSTMKILLKFKGYINLTDAYNSAIIISNEMEQENSRTKTPPLLNSSAPPFIPRNASTPVKVDNGIRMCSYCNKTGHTALQCYRNPRNQNNTSGNRGNFSPRNDNATRQTPKTCSYCNKLGHTVTQCYRNPQNRNPGSGNRENSSPTDARREKNPEHPILKISADEEPST